MKIKTRLFLLFLLLTTSFSFAQTPAWLWARKAGGTNTDMVNSIATDPAGNVYLAGWFNSWPAIFNTDTLYTTGAYDLFLVKYDASGSVIWARSVGGSGNPSYECDDRAYAVTTDANGNVYLAGTFTSPFITFGTYTLTKAGTNYTYADVFLTKYDSSGTVLWAKSGAGGSGINYAYSVSSDATGNVYLAGTYASTSITFDTITLTNGTLFLAKFNAGGNIVWAKTNAGNFYGPLSIATTNSGNTYLAGTYYGNSVSFGTTTLSHTGGLAYHMFLLKYDASGNLSWVRGENGNFDDYGYAVATDASGNAFVVGAFLSNTVAFGSITLTNTAAAPSYDSFIIKYNANGTELWAKSADGTTGANWPGSNDRPYSVATDATGNAYMTGAFLCSTLTFGNTTLTNNSTSGYFDIYVVKYGNSGNVIGACSAGGSNTDYAYAAKADAFGNVYVAGSFVSPSIIFGPDTLSNIASQDIFLAKMDGSLIIGRDKTDNANDLLVYPNPSDGVFTIQFDRAIPFNMEIFNVLGEKVFQALLKSRQVSNKINFSPAPRGIYFIRLNDGTKTFSKKILVL